MSLLLWAAEVAVVGEAVRGLGTRWLPVWRTSELAERVVLDVYLGGGVLYLLAAVELGGFIAPVVRAVPIAAAVVLLYRVARLRRTPGASAGAEPLRELTTNSWVLLAFASALALYVVEVVAALAAPTGNTYDSSLLTTYVTLLLQHGSVPLSFRPYGAAAILYPQGSTVLLGWAQQTFGLPPARTSVLVTPLFLALVPLSGYVAGRRLLGTAAAGGAFALALAFLGPATRAFVAGSNDFVMATPLVLLLVARLELWRGAAPPSFRDALGFGLLLGYAGALNVVGTQWILPALLVFGLVAAPRFGGRFLSWLLRWCTAAGAALVAGLPSLYVLIAARVSPASLAGALTVTPGTPSGFTSAPLIGQLDPFLFRATDVDLSPIPALRDELALLLVLGAVALLWVANDAEPDPRWRRFGWALLGAGATIAAWLVLLSVSHVAHSPVESLRFISNAGEMSTWLFLLYGLLAAVPLVLAVERFPRLGSGAGGAPRRGRPRGSLPAIAPVLFAALVVLPAIVLTPVGLGPVLSETYQDFGNVTAADFALFDYAASHFVAGERVVVAPGSAAEFLPGYARGIVMLYPMAPGLPTVNASYTLVVRELTNGTLDATGRADLAALTPTVVVVTGNSTVLWRAFWASPLVGLLGSPSVAWHEGDAWVFNASGCRPHTAPCD